MNPELLKTVIDGQFSEWMKVSMHPMAAGEEVCRVILPLWEPSGDVVTAYVSESDDQVVIDDGGHISGLLFGARPKGPTTKDRSVVEQLLLDSGLKRDPDTGVVSVETTEDGLRYWLIELGRVIALVPALLPVDPPLSPLSDATKSRGRTAREIRNRLVHEGFSKAILPPHKVRGISDRTHTVDMSYETLRPFFELHGGPKTTVHVLALDLNVARPFEKADRSIAIANDLIWSADDADEVDVRIVYGCGNESGGETPAAKLLATAGEKLPFNRELYTVLHKDQ